MKTIFITGSEGFIGKTLVRTLLSEGYQVVGIDLNAARGEILIEYGLMVDGSITVKASRLEELTYGKNYIELINKVAPDCIIHAAAQSSVDSSINSPIHTITNNIGSTAILLEAVEASGIKCTTVIMSTDEVYGAWPEGRVPAVEEYWTEDSPTRPNSPYSASKLASEAIAHAYHKTYGLSIVVTRGCNTYGGDQSWDKIIPKAVKSCMTGEGFPVYGKGEQVRGWIHVKDHANAVIKAGRLYNSGYHTLNIGSEFYISNIELLSAISHYVKLECGKSILLKHATDRLGHDFAYYMSSALATKAIGYTPPTAMTYLRETVATLIQRHQQLTNQL